MKSSRIEDFLKELVDSPSQTSKQDDVRRTHAILVDALTGMGFQIDWRRDPSGKTDDLLVAERPSLHTNDRRTDFITFVSHVDTVLDPTEVGPYRRVTTPFGIRAHGAGIIDNKGGLAVLVESLRLFLSRNHSPAIGFRVISSPDEENGSSAWHETYREFGVKSVAVLGFEPALDDGSIVSSRRGNRWYDISIRGTEAHAGRCKGEEINAAHEAARIVSRLLNLRDRLRSEFNNQPGHGISVHVGHIEGGRKRHNIVCGDVQIKLDTRFSNFSERECLHSEILKILNSPEENSINGDTASVSFKIVDDCPPFDENSETRSLVDELCQLIATSESRRSLQPAKAGGAGDVNHMSRPGLLVLDGLGPVGGHMHTKDEFLEFATLETRAQALCDWYPSLIKYCLPSQ